MRVLGISGSLRADSYNTQLLRNAAELLPEGLELELYDGLRDLPPYDQDVEDAGAPAAVQHLRDRIAAADAVLLATPEYNGSIPGVLKNAVDWASRPRGEAALLNRPAPSAASGPRRTSARCWGSRARASSRARSPSATRRRSSRAGD